MFMITLCDEPVPSEIFHFKNFEAIDAGRRVSGAHRCGEPNHPGTLCASRAHISLQLAFLVLHPLRILQRFHLLYVLASLRSIGGAWIHGFSWTDWSGCWP